VISGVSTKFSWSPDWKLAETLTVALSRFASSASVIASAASSVDAEPPSVCAAAAAAVLGHVFPVWLRFHGGKGVATGLGVFLVLAPLATLCAVVFFVLVVWLWRYVSLGSLIAALILPLAVWTLSTLGVSDRASQPLLCLSILGAALIVFMHRANVGRLLRGEESKLK
jgi:glycerol-3-phosphate acyltransferase PlsY